MVKVLFREKELGRECKEKSCRPELVHLGPASGKYKVDKQSLRGAGRLPRRVAAVNPGERRQRLQQGQDMGCEKQKAQSILAPPRLHVCTFACSLKCISNPKIDTQGGFADIHRHAQYGENFELPSMHVSS